MVELKLNAISARLELAQERAVLRNERLVWRAANNYLIGVCLALASLRLPAYCLLWIVDCLDGFEQGIKHIKKIRRIEATIISIRKCKWYQQLLIQ